MTRAGLATIGLILAALGASNASAQAARLDPSRFPKALQGLWGTSEANCSNRDDYGPLHVDADGFGHYEVSSESIAIKSLEGRSFQVTYTVRDIASEDLEVRKEIWTLSPDGNTLIIDYPTGSERDVFSRCELLK